MILQSQRAPSPFSDIDKVTQMRTTAPFVTGVSAERSAGVGETAPLTIARCIQLAHTRLHSHTLLPPGWSLTAQRAQPAGDADSVARHARPRIHGEYCPLSSGS